MGVVPNDLSLAISVALLLRFVRELTIVAALVKRFLVWWNGVVENFLAR